jgi:hypothetical protein
MKFSMLLAISEVWFIQKIESESSENREVKDTLKFSDGQPNNSTTTNSNFMPPRKPHLEFAFHKTTQRPKASMLKPSSPRWLCEFQGNDFFSLSFLHFHVECERTQKETRRWQRQMICRKGEVNSIMRCLHNRERGKRCNYRSLSDEKQVAKVQSRCMKFPLSFAPEDVKWLYRIEAEDISMIEIFEIPIKCQSLQTCQITRDMNSLAFVSKHFHDIASYQQ